MMNLEQATETEHVNIEQVNDLPELFVAALSTVEFAQSLVPV